MSGPRWRGMNGARQSGVNEARRRVLNGPPRGEMNWLRRGGRRCLRGVNGSPCGVDWPRRGVHGRLGGVHGRLGGVHGRLGGVNGPPRGGVNGLLLPRRRATRRQAPRAPPLLPPPGRTRPGARPAPALSPYHQISHTPEIPLARPPEFLRCRQITACSLRRGPARVSPPRRPVSCFGACYCAIRYCPVGSREPSIGSVLRGCAVAVARAAGSHPRAMARGVAPPTTRVARATGPGARAMV
jgi:hypothetical protein